MRRLWLAAEKIPEVENPNDYLSAHGSNGVCEHVGLCIVYIYTVYVPDPTLAYVEGLL